MVVSTDSSEENNSEEKPKSEEDCFKKGQERTYNKNIIGYQAKKIIKIMFGNQSKYLSKKCRKLGIKYKDFKKTFKAFEDDLSGPLMLTKLFEMKP